MSSTTTDPIADMLTRIRNAMKVSKNEIRMPHSIIKESIARVLLENNYLTKVSVDGKIPLKELIIEINKLDANPRILEIKKLSTPGRRLYVNSKEIPTVRQGKGIVILSTSKGILSGDKAKRLKVGGELICEVI